MRKVAQTKLVKKYSWILRGIQPHVFCGRLNWPCCVVYLISLWCIRYLRPSWFVDHSSLYGIPSHSDPCRYATLANSIDSSSCKWNNATSFPMDSILAISDAVLPRLFEMDSKTLSCIGLIFFVLFMLVCGNGLLCMLSCSFLFVNESFNVNIQGLIIRDIPIARI